MSCKCVKNNSYKSALLKAKSNETPKKKWGVYFVESFKMWFARPISQINKMESVCCYHNTNEEEVQNVVAKKTTSKKAKEPLDETGATEK